MAPVGMAGMLGQFSSPEVGLVSLLIFFILSITLVNLCAACKRTTDNAYDVSGTTTEGANGTAGNQGGSLDWRNHSEMPDNLVEKSRARTE